MFCTCEEADSTNSATADKWTDRDPTSRLGMPESGSRAHGVSFLIVLALIAAAHVVCYQSDEPVFNGDENRHLMTGVYFHDLIHDLPITDVRRHAERYYMQYPALGLLIWPPLFHAMLGTWMVAFGISVTAAKVLVGLFAGMACWYLYRLVRITHGEAAGTAAVALFSLTPLVFSYSRHVMLEIPTLAWGLMALFYFHRFLEEERRKDVFLAAAASAATALTRFDAAYLLPCFLILLTLQRRWTLLRRWDLWAAAGLAILTVAPYYTLVVHEVGSLHLRQASHSVMPNGSSFLAARNFAYYPGCLPEQVGWPLCLLSVLGLLVLRQPESRQRNWPYVALFLATYVTFSPLAELEERHAIYWIPAVVVLALEGMTVAFQLVGSIRLKPVAVGAFVVATANAAFAIREPHIQGYEAAARHVVRHCRNSGRVLFDGWWDGNFTYQLRRLDPQRRFWVLRGDKLLYSYICVPDTNFQQYVATDEEIQQVINRHAPDYIVVEEPQIMEPIAIAQRLRTVLHQHPERFRLEASIPVRGHRGLVGNFRINVYRNLVCHPSTARDLAFTVLGANKVFHTRRPGDNRQTNPSRPPAAMFAPPTAAANGHSSSKSDR